MNTTPTSSESSSQQDDQPVVTEAVINAIETGQHETVDSMLAQVASNVQSNSPDIRSAGVITLVYAAASLAGKREWVRLQRLMPAIEHSANYLEPSQSVLLKKVLSTIPKLTEHFIEEKAYSEAQETVNCLHRITEKFKSTRTDVAGLAQTTLNKFIAKPYVEQLIHDYLGNSPGKESAGNLLTCLGDQALRLMMQQLLATKDKSNKKYLLSLIHESRSSAQAILLRYMEKTPPEKLSQGPVALLAEVGSSSALPFLEEILGNDQREAAPAGYSEDVRQTALQVHRKLQPAPPEMGPADTVQTDKQSPVQDTSTARLDTADPGDIDQETAIFALAEQGSTEEAKQALYELVVTRAQSGDFSEAERLRERIYEIDPMALTEIIRSGEIIEQEKSGAVTQEDQQIWAEFASICTSEEFNAVYHSLEHKTFQPEEIVIEQGENNNSLLFINQGSLKVAHRAGDHEIFITTLGKGDLIGENFFTPSVWTVSLTSLTRTKIMVLSQEQLARLEETFNGLRKKLHEFYNAHNSISTILEKKGLERRKYNRYSISRKIQVIPLNNRAEPVGRGFRAEIIDISIGGLAFIIRISKLENAKLLLGRKLQVVLPVGGSPGYLHLVGRCIGVQPYSAFESDYSIHLQFDNLLEQEALQNIIG